MSLRLTIIILKSSPAFRHFYIEPIYRKIDGFSHKLELDAQGLDFTEQLLSLILTESKKNNAQFNHAVRIYFTSHILFLSKEYEKGKVENSNIMQISDTLAYIERNFRKNLTVLDLSQKAYMSEKNFTIFQILI